jgi:chromosome segregation ATPase
MRAFFYMITGRVDAARKELSKNPYVVQATYDRIVEEKTRNIQRYKEAVAGMIAQQEKKMASIKSLSEETKKLESLKEGAAAKARTVADRLKAEGATVEAIKQHEEYKKCLGAFNDFSSTLEEKTSHIADLEEDVKGLGNNIGNHKVQLQQLLRDIEKLKAEAADTVADMISAKEEENVANMIAGISDNRYEKELADMRDLRDQSKAKARVSRELAGTDTKQLEAEFMEYARTTVSTSEFDKLIGLAAEADAPQAAPAAQEKSQLPEG